jgi:hypothetical protein
MTTKYKSTLVVVLAILLSSCSVLTKTRYGNGIKLNLEWGLFSKQKADSAYLKKHHTPRENRPTGAAPIDDHTDILKPEQMRNIPSDSLFSSTIINVPQQQGIANPDFTKTAISQQQIKEIKGNSTEPEPTITKAPFEKNAKIAGWLFYGGIITLAIGIGIIAMLVGFIYAIRALKKIKEEEKKGNHLRGKGLALSIIIISAIPFTLAIFLLIFIVFLADKVGFNIGW